MMTSYSRLIQTGSHIIGVYPSEKVKLDTAFAFLKDGLFRNEAVMLITDSMPKVKIIKRMTKEWNVDVPRLVATNDIIIKRYRIAGRPGDCCLYFIKVELDAQIK